MKEVLYDDSPFCGYGECQHFHDLPARADLRRGDSLQLACTFSNHEGLRLVVGVSRLQEMCGAAVIYSPNNLTRLVPAWYEGAIGTLEWLP